MVPSPFCMGKESGASCIGKSLFVHKFLIYYNPHFPIFFLTLITSNISLTLLQQNGSRNATTFLLHRPTPIWGGAGAVREPLAGPAAVHKRGALGGGVPEQSGGAQVGGGGADSAGRDGEGVCGAHDGADEEGDGGGAVGVFEGKEPLGEGDGGGPPGREHERESCFLHGDHLSLLHPQV